MLHKTEDVLESPRPSVYTSINIIWFYFIFCGVNVDVWGIAIINHRAYWIATRRRECTSNNWYKMAIIHWPRKSNRDWGRVRWPFNMYTKSGWNYVKLDFRICRIVRIAYVNFISLAMMFPPNLSAHTPTEFNTFSIYFFVYFDYLVTNQRAIGIDDTQTTNKIKNRKCKMCAKTIHYSHVQSTRDYFIFLLFRSSSLDANLFGVIKATCEQKFAVI